MQMLPSSLYVLFKQTLLDEEKEAMERARKLERSSSGFDFSTYHTIEEVIPSAVALSLVA